MANRMAGQKPDPAIRKKIAQARRGRQGEKAQAIVVAASLAATLLSWAAFAGMDAQSAAVEAAATAPVATATGTQSAGNAGTPVISGLEDLWAALLSGVMN